MPTGSRLNLNCRGWNPGCGGAGSIRLSIRPTTSLRGIRRRRSVRCPGVSPSVIGRQTAPWWCSMPTTKANRPNKATVAAIALSADEALARLIAGNERFRCGEAYRDGFQRERLADLAKGQHPYATILGCSDSRVPPECIFDAGMGELFVIRVAGNVFSPEIAGSLQYAGSHLHTPLFVVLGHEGCGAVHAALETKSAGAKHKSRIQILVDTILPGLPD